MQPSRRAFIAAAAVAPVAASMPAASAALPIEPPIPIQTPYTDYPWRWMVSNDDYSYSENFETLEKALEHARAVGADIVAECQMQDFNLSVDGDNVLEMLRGQNEDLVGEGEFIDPTREQTKELGAMMTEAIEHWAIKHRVSLTAWTFAGIRNKQKLAE